MFGGIKQRIFSRFKFQRENELEDEEDANAENSSSSESLSPCFQQEQNNIEDNERRFMAEPP